MCGGVCAFQQSKFDVIIEYFIIHGRYDIFEINEVLFSYDQPPLLGGLICRLLSDLPAGDACYP